ncbi:group 1 truncated hemoglobin [Haloferax larsenii]|uniref:Group 1 truncated hemoglobin n=1 Tax=Haloferax larsenii TaxID=302484 RepID=A0ABY5RC11_HALLR|nr:group 1 truncated hemoglobin [Haloferax larsenii]ELZ81483.1 cyanoglobin [Haloferax larsenii JCM 13917]UVE49901.1 group 1 truncated hemoglobin [Haloferax larsenii]
MQDQSLYSEIGGHEAVDAVVSDFYDRVLADESVAHYFDDTDMAKQHAHQVQFISAVAGGPVEYDGEDMRDAHAHLGLTGDDFDAIANHLEVALRDNGVSESNRAAILDEVEALRAPILNQ